MNNEDSFMTRVRRVNEILEKGEPRNTQVKYHSDKRFVSYTAQAVVDAVNEVFGLEWSYTTEIVSTRSAEKSFHAVVKVIVSIMGNTREAYGEGTSPGNQGDALKAATTDALKKALGAFSIGNKAFLGQLTQEGNDTKTYETTESSTPITEKQGRLLKALLAGARLRVDFWEENKDRIKEITDKYDRETETWKMTKSEATKYIDWLKEHKNEPYWED